MEDKITSVTKVFTGLVSPYLYFHPQVLFFLLIEVFCLMHFIKLPFIFLFIHSFLLKYLTSTEKAIYNVCVYIHIFIYMHTYTYAKTWEYKFLPVCVSARVVLSPFLFIFNSPQHFPYELISKQIRNVRKCSNIFLCYIESFFKYLFLIQYD